MERSSKNNKDHTEQLGSVESHKESLISKVKPSSGGITISHSSVDKYKTCSKLWDLHYNQRIRSKRTSSALLFGTCLDECMNKLLENIDKDNVRQLAIDTFNKEMNSWMSWYNVDFFDKDFDKRLLSDEDKKVIDESEPDHQSHLYGWFCLYRRGLHYIDQYIEQVIPLIDKVEDVQRKINKTNQHGDTIIGYLDAVITWKPCAYNPDSSFTSVSDHKTSSASYSQRKTNESTQLALYTKFSGIEHQSFVVFRKDLDAKGNIRPIQVLHAPADPHVSDRVLQSFDYVLDNVKEGNFLKTTKKWQCKKMFGKKCVYYDICYNGKDVSECPDLEVKK